jgi:excisionase family DNA binding protein
MHNEQENNKALPPKHRRDGFRRLTLSELKELVTISVEEASWLLGVSRSTLYVAVSRGEIPATRVHKRWRVLAQPLYSRLVGNVESSGS